MAWKPSKLVTLATLKEALEKIKNGFTMLGTLTFKRGVVEQGKQDTLIYAKWRDGNNVIDTQTSILRVIGTNKNNNFNPGIAFGSLAGSTVITAGEGGQNFPEMVNLDDREDLHLVSDQGIYLYLGVPNGTTDLGTNLEINNVGQFLLQRRGLVKGTNPSNDVWFMMRNRDANKSEVSAWDSSVGTDGTTFSYMRTYRFTAGSSDYTEIRNHVTSAGGFNLFYHTYIGGTNKYYNLLPPVNSVQCMATNTAPSLPGTWSNIGSQTIGSTTVYYFKRTA